MLNSNERIIKHKLGLLSLAEELGNASKACKAIGYPATRSTATRARWRMVVSNHCSIRTVDSDATLCVRAAKSFEFVMRRDKRVNVALCITSVAGPAVISRMRHHAGPYGIEFDVTVAGQYIFIPLGEA